MTKALDTGRGLPAPIPDPEIMLWVLPEAIAFQSNAQQVSKLFMARSAALLIRCTAELIHSETQPSGSRLQKKAVASLAIELFGRAANEVPITTVRQSTRADVAMGRCDDHSTGVNLFLSPLLVRAELERATVFMLRATFRAMVESRTVLTPTEFSMFIEELACDMRSAPLKIEGQG